MRLFLLVVAALADQQQGGAQIGLAPQGYPSPARRGLSLFWRSGPMDPPPRRRDPTETEILVPRRGSLRTSGCCRFLREPPVKEPSLPKLQPKIHTPPGWKEKMNPSPRYRKLLSPWSTDRGSSPCFL